MTSFPWIPYTDINAPVQIGGAGRHNPKSLMRDTNKLYPMDMRTNMFSKFNDLWQNTHRDLVVTLTYSLQRPPSDIQEILHRLLHANYAKILRNIRRWRKYGQYVSRASIDELFDENGNVLDPLNPTTLSLLMRMLYNYICCLQRLNATYKWYNNGNMESNVFALVGSHDELYKLISRIADNGKFFDQRVLLQMLFDKHVSRSQLARKQTGCSFEGISDLYANVVQDGKPLIRQISANSKLSVGNTLQSDYCIRRLETGNLAHRFERNRTKPALARPPNRSSIPSSPCKQTCKTRQPDRYMDLMSIWGR